MTQVLKQLAYKNKKVKELEQKLEKKQNSTKKSAKGDYESSYTQS